MQMEAMRMGELTPGEPRSPLTVLAHPALVSGMVLLASLPMLAVAPLNGDAAEFLGTAQFGGVNHPPGFPLQSWLHRLFILLAIPEPAVRLGLVSCLAHAGLVAVLICILERLGTGRWLAVAGALGITLFPPVWSAGLQLEVFALAWLLVGLVLLQSTTLALEAGTPISTASAVWVGVLVALAGAQHPVTVVTAPAFLVSAGVAITRAAQGTRWRVFARMAVPFLVVFCGLYASLLLLRRPHGYPDWGGLASLGDVARHALRREYGTLSLARGTERVALRGITVLVEDLGYAAFPLALLAAAGAGAAWRLRPALGVALAGTTAAALLFLCTGLGGDSAVHRAVLERFAGVALVPGGLLAVLGLSAVLKRCHHAAQRAAGPVFLLAALTMGFLNRSDVDASQDVTLHVLSATVGQALPTDAVYVARADVDIFLGAALPDGTRRYPLALGLLEVAWYRDEAMRRVEPRALGSSGNALALMRSALDAGLVLATTEDGPLEGLEGNREVRGPLVLVSRAARNVLTPQTVHAALGMCPLLAQLNDGPSGRHPLTRLHWNPWVRGMRAASDALDLVGKRDEGALARSIAEALASGGPASAWRDGCAALTARMVR